LSFATRYYPRGICGIYAQRRDNGAGSQWLIQGFSDIKTSMIKIIPLPLILLVLACCSNQSQENPRALDACSILTKADAQAALGDMVRDANAKNFGGGNGVATVSNCLYSSAGTDTFKTISILIRSGASSEKSDGRIQSHVSDLKKQFGEQYVLEPVSGIADGAVWDPKLNQLTFFKGRDMVILSKHPGTKDELVALATKVAGKL
jgi:hypothetical protein